MTCDSPDLLPAAGRTVSALRLRQARDESVFSRLPISLILAALAAIVFFVPGLSSILQFDRIAIEHGQWWRIITCHWTHWSLDHLLWNVLAFAGLGWLLERIDRRGFWIAAVGSTLTIPLAIWIAQPQFQTYRGLSGIDSGLFVAIAIRILIDRFRSKDWTAFAGSASIILLFTAKTWIELRFGQTIFVESNVSGTTVVPLAHLIGGIFGVVSIVRIAYTKLQRTDPLDSIER